MALVMDDKWHYCFFVDLPLVLHFALSELCHKYICYFNFPCRRSGCGRDGRKVCWFLIRLPKNFTEENVRHTMFCLLVKFPFSVNDVKTWRETWNFFMKFALRLRFTRVFMSITSLSRACSFFNVSGFLLHFPMRTKTIFDMIFKLILCSIFP